MLHQHSAVAKNQQAGGTEAAPVASAARAVHEPVAGTSRLLHHRTLARQRVSPDPVTSCRRSKGLCRCGGDGARLDPVHMSHAGPAPVGDEGAPTRVSVSPR